MSVQRDLDRIQANVVFFRLCNDFIMIAKVFCAFKLCLVCFASVSKNTYNPYVRKFYS